MVAVGGALAAAAIAIGGVASQSTQPAVAANAVEYGLITAFRFDPDVSGLTYIHQARRAATTYTFMVSAHDLEPGTPYRFVASSRPCSLNGTPDSVIAAVRLATEADGNDKFVSRRVPRRRTLQAIRSMRAVMLGGAAPTTVACVGTKGVLHR
jgi:hypothetical protein